MYLERAGALARGTIEGELTAKLGGEGETEGGWPTFRCRVVSRFEAGSEWSPGEKDPGRRILAKLFAGIMLETRGVVRSILLNDAGRIQRGLPLIRADLPRAAIPLDSPAIASSPGLVGFPSYRFESL